MRYQLILFDCVNTLYLPDPSRLPRLRVDGRMVTSTAELLHDRLRALDPKLDVETVHHAARAAWKWAEQQRGPEHREVPAPRRFERLFLELGLPADDPILMESVLVAHMAAVTSSFTFPEAHRRLLAGLRSTHRIGLLSNFDHGPSLLNLLESTGIADWFNPLLISDGLGFRKPGNAAFTRALEQIGLPRQHVLYVGDSMEDDVKGCRDFGLDVAWINARGETAPDDCRPTYELTALTELPSVL